MTRSKTTITTAVFLDQQEKLYRLSSDLDVLIAALPRTALDYWLDAGAPLRPSTLQDAPSPTQDAPSPEQNTPTENL